MRIFDISLPLRPAMVVWPGDPAFERAVTSDMRRGDLFNLSVIRMSAHTGTHVDAPRHFIDGGRSIDRIDPSVFIGPCRVAAVEDRAAIDLDAVEALALDGIERLLFKTRNSARLERAAFVTDYVALTPEAARYLASLGSLRLVGVDYLSIAPYGERDAVPVHHALLGRSIVALEGIDLRAVEPGDYELVALPLRIEGADGSPVRAVLIQR
jgi:arylformamidase